MLMVHKKDDTLKKIWQKISIATLCSTIKHNSLLVFSLQTEKFDATCCRIFTYVREWNEINKFERAWHTKSLAVCEILAIFIKNSIQFDVVKKWCNIGKAAKKNPSWILTKLFTSKSVPIFFIYWIFIKFFVCLCAVSYFPR